MSHSDREGGALLAQLHQPTCGGLSAIHLKKQNLDSGTIVVIVVVTFANGGVKETVQIQ